MRKEPKRGVEEGEMMDVECTRKKVQQKGSDKRYAWGVRDMDTKE